MRGKAGGPIMLSLFLIVSLAAATFARTDAIAVEAGRTAEGASIVVHRQPAVPLVALRMSLLTYDPPGFSGAGHMVQHVQYPGLRDRAARVGGRVQIQRTSDAVVYTVIGPATELDYLAGLLISTLELPSPPLDVVLRAERELREERLAEWETAPSHARSVLRAQLFPEDLSSTGTDRSTTRFTPSALPGIWSRMYRPERMAVVAVGDVYLSDVQRAFANMPAPREVPTSVIERDSVVLTSLAPPQATRAWLGSAYLASDLPPAAITIAARLVRDDLQGRLPAAQVDVEHWWTHHGQALAIVVAAPGSTLTTARTMIATSIGRVLDELDEEGIRDAATAIRREMLFFARTPDRMADVIGQFIDRDGDETAAERFYAGLSEVTEEDVEEVLDTLLGRTPARVELPPQVIPPRQR